MSWGAHGVMGELKSPLGMMVSAALFPLTSGHSASGVPAIMPFAKKLSAALFPVILRHSVLGVPCFLLLFFIYGFPSVVGFFFAKLRHLRWWRVCPGFGCPSSGVAALWVHVARLLLSRMQ